MITVEKIKFAGELLFPNFQAYFFPMVAAIERQDEAALAKFSALVIIELSQRGELISDKAAKWIRLFGNLPDFGLLTQVPS